MTNDDVKAGKRRYQAPRRAEQAAATRRAILAAARDLFMSRGYATTTVAETQQSAQELARMSAELQSVVANFRV